MEQIVSNKLLDSWNNDIQLGMTLFDCIKQSIDDGYLIKDIDIAYQKFLSSDVKHKHDLGSYYTPDDVVDALVDQALTAAGAFTHGPLKILDPACGTGSMLRGVVRWYQKNKPDVDLCEVYSNLSGVDIDPVAILIAKENLKYNGNSGLFTVCDSLLMDTVKFYDVVLMNPPFISTLKDKSRKIGDVDIYASQYSGIADGSYNKASLFLSFADRCVVDGGVIASLIPKAILSAPYTEGLREYLTTSRGVYSIITFENNLLFENANVYISGIVLGGKVSKNNLLVNDKIKTIDSNKAQWGVIVSPYSFIVSRSANWPTLGELVDIRASATVDEAYEYQKYIIDKKYVLDEFRFVTTGAIDPYICYWGNKKQKYLKNNYMFPLLPKNVLSPVRLALYSKPKVLVGGLSSVLEACIDYHGVFAGAVATLSVTRNENTPEHFTLERIAALLNSDFARRFYIASFGAMAICKQIQVTKNKLSIIPVPPIFLEHPVPFDLHKGSEKPNARIDISYQTKRLLDKLALTMISNDSKTIDPNDAIKYLNVLSSVENTMYYIDLAMAIRYPELLDIF